MEGLAQGVPVYAQERPTAEECLCSVEHNLRTFRNRVFHNEPICWNLDRVEEIHRKMTTAMSWINKDVPGWLNQIDRFGAVCENIRLAMGWKE